MKKKKKNNKNSISKVIEYSDQILQLNNTLKSFKEYNQHYENDLEIRLPRSERSYISNKILNKKVAKYLTLFLIREKKNITNKLNGLL